MRSLALAAAEHHHEQSGAQDQRAADPRPDPGQLTDEEHRVERSRYRLDVAEDRDVLHAHARVPSIHSV